MAGGGGGGGGSANSGDDNALNIIWMIFFGFLIGVLIWVTWGEHFKNFFLWLKKTQLIIINFIMKILPLELLHLNWARQDIAKALDTVNNLKADDLTLEMSSYISFITGRYLSFPVILLLISFCYIGFIKNPSNKYKKTYNMNSLALQETTEWPQIKPVIGLNLIKEPLTSGVWAIGKSPLDFCKENDLITIKADQNKEFKTGSNVSFNMILDEDKAELIFAQQLGKLWKSPESLAIHQRALFAIFAARACREPDVSFKLLRQINMSSNSKNHNVLDFNNVDNVWKKYYDKKIIQGIINNHAYEFTMFIDLLILARQDGVLPTADFLWLKPIDRLFWYVLNSTGRQTYFVEAAGVHAHYLVEKSLGRALSVPYVKEAVKALNLALKEIIYVPTEDEKEVLLKNAT